MRLRTQGSSLMKLVREKKVEIAVFFLLLFSIGIKLYRLDNPDSYYFDEIYFAFTAQEMARGNPAGWELGHRAPKGFAYEWTHPPLGKELSALGILVFGDNPFGWRFFQAIFGGLGTLIIYLLGKELFESKGAGLIASFLFTFESFVFVLSRIAMVDVFLMSFILVASLFLVKYVKTGKTVFLLLSGVFSGASMSVKWSGVYATEFLGCVSFLVMFYRNIYTSGTREKRLPVLLKIVLKVALFFVFIPAVVYILTYIPFFLHGNSLGDFVRLQESMYGYHRGVKQTHPYQSSWWQWPLLLRPVYLYLKRYGNEYAHIYAIGNPFIWWTGCLFFILGVITLIRKEAPSLAFSVLSVVAYWLPWALSPRKLTFLYHFLPALPFMLLISAYFLDLLWKRSRYGKTLVIVYLITACAVFFFFYPILAAVPVSNDSLKWFFWLKGWR